MSPSMRRSEDDLVPSPASDPAADRELKSVSDELGAIFAPMFSAAAGAADTGKRRRVRSRRPPVVGLRSGYGRWTLIVAGAVAGFCGLCLGALMEKTAILSSPQSRDGAAFAAVAVTPSASLTAPQPDPVVSPPPSSPTAPMPSTPPTPLTPPAPLTSPALTPPVNAPPPPLEDAPRPVVAAEAASTPAGGPVPAPDVRVASGTPARTAAASKPPQTVHASHKPLSLAALAARPLPLNSRSASPIAPSPVGAPPEPARPAPTIADGRLAPRCDWRRICGATAAVLQADGRLREAYSAAARAGVNPEILEAFRQNWAEMRYALSNQPPQLLNGYRQLTESLWQARRLALSGRDRGSYGIGSERDYGGPPE